MVAIRSSEAEARVLSLTFEAQAGSVVALEALIDRYKPNVYRTIFSIVRNREDAEDIAQDVWLKVAQHIDGLREPSRFYFWLMRIARNTAYHVTNARRNRPLVSFRDDGQLESVIDHKTPTPESALLSSDSRREVWEVLNALSERDRTVLILREYEGRSYAEIARIVGISRGAAEVQTFRARARFRKYFAGRT